MYTCMYHDSPVDAILTDTGENFNNKKNNGFREAGKGIVLNELNQLGNVTHTERRRERDSIDKSMDKTANISKIRYLGLEMLAMASGLCLSRSVRTVGGWLSLATPTFSPII